MVELIKAVSKNKITHYIQPNSKRTLCGLNATKGSWSFWKCNVEHPRCECCERQRAKLKDDHWQSVVGIDLTYNSNPENGQFTKELIPLAKKHIPLTKIFTDIWQK